MFLIDCIRVRVDGCSEVFVDAKKQLYEYALTMNYTREESLDI